MHVHKQKGYLHNGTFKFIKNLKHYTHKRKTGNTWLYLFDSHLD